ncbi:TrlF family AAA-like ATPase, partial [Rahnella aceris]|uniref:TrlF family AAA-like ATPase n=1 Tax=Rahnella sp. (strain Y9602) TaxID=2703885 RepID=UPI001C26B8FF
ILDGQQIKLSKNLTCIIGGRGTGKSTLLEAIRETSGNSSQARVIDSDVWPDEIELFFEDETNKVTHFKREKNNILLNVTDLEEGIQKVVIDSYGQGETADTIQHSDDNPKMLLNFLDDFIDIKSLIAEDIETRDLLLENQSALNKARLEVTGIDDTIRQITSLDEKRKRLEQDKVGDLVKYQIALITEKGIREKIIQDIIELIKSYRDILKNNEVFNYFTTIEDDKVIIGKEQFTQIKIIIEEFSQVVSLKSDELNVALNDKLKLMKAQLVLWKNKETETQEKIDEKKKELEAAGIPFDLGKINQIAKDLEYYNKRLISLKTMDKKRKQLEKDRGELINKRIQIKGDVFRKRYLFSLKINNNLKNSVDGFFVNASFNEGCYSPSFEISLKQTMDWRTTQVSKAERIASCMSPLDFCANLKSKDFKKIKELTDGDGRKIFQDSDIENIINKCSTNFCFEDFESLEYEDRPSLQVTKVVEDSNGKKDYITKSIAKLSLGQQQSILLAILIHSESTNPLLIDQPEDNLDSEFIFKTIVANLRKIKERRQVIIVTHNANIAVLGDAELIIPLKSTNVKSQVISRGSIDKVDIRDLCCDILEGGRRAFNSRQELYGVKF